MDSWCRKRTERLPTWATSPALRPTPASGLTRRLQHRSMGSAYTSSTVYTILSPANTPGGLPIINPACAVVTSYLRTQPTRIWTPTETLRFQSTAIKNVSMNGNVHYTRGNHEHAELLRERAGTERRAVRSVIWSGGHASAQPGGDWRRLWASSGGHSATVSLADQATYSSTHEPGILRSFPCRSRWRPSSGAGNQTINYSGPLTAGVGSLPHGINGTLVVQLLWPGIPDQQSDSELGCFGARPVCPDLSLQQPQHRPGRSTPGPIPIVVSDPVSGTITINENAGVFNAALHLAKNWDLNGTVEIGYADNAFTAVGQRQFRQLPGAHDLQAEELGDRLRIVQRSRASQ